MSVRPGVDYALLQLHNQNIFAEEIQERVQFGDVQFSGPASLHLAILSAEKKRLLFEFSLLVLHQILQETAWIAVE